MRTSTCLKGAVLAASVLLVAAVAPAAGCDESSVVLIRIDASHSTLSQLDTLEVTVAASRTDTGDELCEPSTETFTLDSASADSVSLPLVISVLPGREFNRILYVRVVGRSLGSIRIKTERIASLQGGEIDLRIPLTSDCLDKGVGRTEHCVNSVVQESFLSPILDERLFVVEGTPCLAE